MVVFFLGCGTSSVKFGSLSLIYFKQAPNPMAFSCPATVEGFVDRVQRE